MKNHDPKKSWIDYLKRSIAWWEWENVGDGPKNEKGKLPKKVKDLMPLEFFCKYFKYTIFRVKKLVGVNSTMTAPRYIFIMALDI